MDRRFISLFFIVFIDLIGLGIMIPVLILYAEENLGASDFQATFLLTTYSLGLLIAAPILGRLSDAFGRRPVLIVSQIGTMIGFLILGLSNVLWLLFIGRIIDGISGGNITTAQAYINDITTEENRARGFGILAAAFGAGFIVGPALGGLSVAGAATIPMLAPYSQKVPFFLAALFSLGSTLGTFFILKESLPPEERSPIGQLKKQKTGDELGILDLLRPSGVRLILSFAAMTFLAFAMLQSAFALFARRNIYPPDMPLEKVQGGIGLLLLTIGVTNVLMQLLFVGPLVERLGERRLVALATIIRCGAFAAIGLSRTPLGLAIVLIPFAVGNSVSQPSLQSLISRFAPPTMRGRLMGIYSSVQSLTLVIGPIAAGIILEAEFPKLTSRMANAMPFFVGAGLIFVAFFLSLSILRMQVPSQEQPVTQPAAAPAN